jgi:hypothetical protein
LGEEDHEAGVARGLLDGGVEEVKELRLAGVLEGVESGLVGEGRVFGEGGDEGDVLGGGAGEV